MKSFNPFPKSRKEKKEVEDPPKKIVEKWMIILKIHKNEGYQDMFLGITKTLCNNKILGYQN